MTLLDQCETVAGGTTDFQQPAELCSIFSWCLNIFLMSVQVEWCMRGIRGSHEAEFASKWSVHNSNDLGHFLRFLSQGWPRTSPYFKSREEALLKTDELCCYPGEELIRPCLRVQFLGCTEKKKIQMVAILRGFPLSLSVATTQAKYWVLFPWQTRRL